MSSVDAIYDRLDQLPARFAEAIREQQAIERAREQERFRTFKPLRWQNLQVTTPAQTFIIGTGSGDPPPIDQGYVGDVRLIGAKISAADTLAAFVGESSNGFPLGAPAASVTLGTLIMAVILIPKSSGIVNGGESIFLTTGAATISRVWVSGWQVAGPEVGKLF